MKQTEVDCEYLKRCCETLTEENRKLHKELQELRALKSTNPYYMQLPATTLTMCPSCERVATTTTTTTTPPSATVTVAKPTDQTTPSSAATPSPFPITRPKFYPFCQTPTTHSHKSAASWGLKWKKGKSFLVVLMGGLCVNIEKNFFVMLFSGCLFG